MTGRRPPQRLAAAGSGNGSDSWSLASESDRPKTQRREGDDPHAGVSSRHWLSEPCERRQCRSQRPASEGCDPKTAWVGVSYLLALAAEAATRRPQDRVGGSRRGSRNAATRRQPGLVSPTLWLPRHPKPGLVSPTFWLSPRKPQRGDPKTAQFQERCVATRRRAGLIGSGVWRSSGWCGTATRSTEDRNSTSFEAARCGLGHGPQRGQASARPGCLANFPQHIVASLLVLG
jgi:hypothetical protein